MFSTIHPIRFCWRTQWCYYVSFLWIHWPRWVSDCTSKWIDLFSKSLATSWRIPANKICCGTPYPRERINKTNTYVDRCEIDLEYSGTVYDHRDPAGESVFGYGPSNVFHRREYQMSVRGQKQVCDSVTVLKPTGKRFAWKIKRTSNHVLTAIKPVALRSISRVWLHSSIWTRCSRRLLRTRRTPSSGTDTRRMCSTWAPNLFLRKSYR